jgi:hypothetical protein
MPAFEPKSFRLPPLQLQGALLWVQGSQGFNPDLYTQFVGEKSSTHPRPSSIALETPLNGSNGTQAGSLCYINAVASSLQVHGDSSKHGLWEIARQSGRPM